MTMRPLWERCFLRSVGPYALLPELSVVSLAPLGTVLPLSKQSGHVHSLSGVQRLYETLLPLGDMDDWLGTRAGHCELDVGMFAIPPPMDVHVGDLSGSER